MNRYLVYMAALSFASLLSSSTFAATYDHGGRCTSKEKANRHLSCTETTFTNNAGQTGYKCSCSDKLVVIDGGLDAGAPMSAGDPISQPAVKPLVPAN